MRSFPSVINSSDECLKLTALVLGVQFGSCQHSSERLHSGAGTSSSVTFSGLRAFREAVFLRTLKIAEETLAEVCREVVHVQVGLEEEREADGVDALQQEVRVRGPTAVTC